LSLRRTHLFEYHEKKGFIIEFAGFEMPLWYEAITPEHLAVRNSAGIFDVTHMGRSLVYGNDAARFLDYMMTRDASQLSQTQGQYTLLCNEEGGIKDDLTAFRLGKEEYLVIYNASNREKNYAWLQEHAPNFHVKVEDISDNMPMFAIQGPKAQTILQKMISTDLSTLRRYWLIFSSYKGLKLSISRSGYTGEEGFEIHLWNVPLSEPEPAVDIWNHILSAGGKDIRPCGLGSRDTLRLEAGMCLYGNDINEHTTPFEARLGFAVKLEKACFIGKEPLMQQKEEGVQRLRVGLNQEQAIPRRGFEVYAGEKKIGEVTSGTLSPLLKQGIAMAYLKPEYTNEGTIVEVSMRGKRVRGEVTSMPFYDTDIYGWKRRRN
jgi:aminomethyltransferase